MRVLLGFEHQALAVSRALLVDEKADAPFGLRVRAGGMTLWLDPTAVSEWEISDNIWVVRGRTRRNIQAISALGIRVYDVRDLGELDRLPDQLGMPATLMPAADDRSARGSTRNE